MALSISYEDLMNPYGEGENVTRFYTLPRRAINRNWFQVHILGSGFAGSFWSWLSVMAVATGWCALFDFVIENEYPNLLGNMDSSPWSIIFIAGAFFLTFRLSIGYNVYFKSVEQFQLIANFVGTTTFIIAGNLKNNLICKNRAETRYCYDPNTGCVNRTTICSNGWTAIRDLKYLLGAELIAIKNELRNAKWLDYDNEFSDDPNYQSGINVAKLPMPKFLRDELSVYSTNYLDGIHAMMEKRVGYLEAVGAIDGHVHRQFHNEFSSVTTAITNILTVRSTGPTPFINTVLYTTFFIYFFTQPWLLWGFYRWWTLLVLGVSSWGVLAMLSIDKLANPYAPPDESYFVFNDLGKIARDMAKQIDNQLGESWKQTESYYAAGEVVIKCDDTVASKCSPSDAMQAVESRQIATSAITAFVNNDIDTPYSSFNTSVDTVSSVGSHLNSRLKAM